MSLVHDFEWDFAQDTDCRLRGDVELRKGAVASDEMRVHLSSLLKVGRSQVIAPLIITDIYDQ